MSKKIVAVHKSEAVQTRKVRHPRNSYLYSIHRLTFNKAYQLQNFRLMMCRHIKPKRDNLKNEHEGKWMFNEDDEVN